MHSSLTSYQKGDILLKRLYTNDLRTVPTILLLRIRSAHLEILGFPIGDAY